ncbi:hypothetical protein MASR2M17_16620 [Aminivibrio sp.]
MGSEMFFIIAGDGLVTFATRFAAVAPSGTEKPAGLERWLRHIPTGILTALIAPALLLPKGYVDFSLQNHYLLAGLVAAAARMEEPEYYLHCYWAWGQCFFSG